MGWEEILVLIQAMVEIICHNIKETSIRCTSIKIFIMISTMDTITKASKPVAAPEAAVASSMQAVVVVMVPRPIKVGKLLLMRSIRIKNRSKVLGAARQSIRLWRALVQIISCRAATIKPAASRMVQPLNIKMKSKWIESWKPGGAEDIPEIIKSPVFRGECHGGYSARS